MQAEVKTGRTAYNAFVSEETARLKQLHPGVAGAEIRKMVLDNWKVSPKNPKVAAVNAVVKEMEGMKVTKTHTKQTKTEEAPEKEKQTRIPTAYNNYMKKKLEELKHSNPEWDHKKRFAEAAMSWKTSEENPRNKPSE